MSSDREESALAAIANVPACAPFVYRPAPGWIGEKHALLLPGNGLDGESGQDRQAGQPTADQLAKQNEARAREQGLREGQAQARAEFDMAIAQQRETILDALRGFGEDRAAYFQRVEGEVVSLALAIARKILRREAQLDPLLLSGLVRVALEKIAGGQAVRLRVHPSQQAAWQEYCAAATDLQVIPELAPDPSLEMYQCRIESGMGSTDLNLDSQLKEIEQGLFDLLAQRPGAR